MVQVLRAPAIAACGGCATASERMMLWCSAIRCTHLHAERVAYASVPEVQQWENPPSETGRSTCLQGALKPPPTRSNSSGPLQSRNV